MMMWGSKGILAEVFYLIAIIVLTMIISLIWNLVECWKIFMR